MAVISKELFNKLIDNTTCQMIHSDFKGCVDCGSFVFFNSIQGVFKFFLPIYILEMIMDRKKINKKYLKKQLKNFMKSWAYGLSMATIFISSICVCRRIIGKFYYKTSLFVPGILCGLSIFLENTRHKLIVSNMFAALVLECGVNYLKGEEIIRNSIVADTLFFMMTNALFMNLFKTNALAKKATLYWFFDPRPKRNDKKNESVLPCCDGKHKCFKHILKDASKYFGTGYAFYVIKRLISKLPKLATNPSSIFSVFFNKQPIMNGLFLGSYVFIYKVICKYLYELEGKEQGVHSLIAGFVAGISYSINPNLQMNVLPPTLTMQLLWINFREKYKIPKWYFMELFFAVCCGILFHFCFLLPNYSPRYFTNLIIIVINGKGKIFLDCVRNYFEKKIKEKGIPITKHMYMTG